MSGCRCAMIVVLTGFLMPAMDVAAQSLPDSGAAPSGLADWGRHVITRDQLAHFPLGTSLGEALHGIIPGAVVAASGRPGGGVNILLATPNTVRGTKGPLVVLDETILADHTQISALTDGMLQTPSFLNDRLAEIDPKDVEQVVVLEPALAIAKYGAQGRGGALEVTTDGGTNGRLRVTTEVGISRSSFTGRYALNMAELAGLTDGPDPFAAVDRSDVQDSIFKSGGLKRFRFAARGGVAGLTYSASAGIHEGNGIIRNETQRRAGARARVTYELNDRFSFGGNASVTRGYTGFVLEDGSSPLFLVLMNPTSHVLTKDSVTDIYPQGYFAVRHNPLARLALESQTHLLQRAHGGFYFSARLPKNFSFNVRAEIDRVQDGVTQLRVDDFGSLVWADTVDVFTNRRAVNTHVAHSGAIGNDWTFDTSLGFRWVTQRGFAETWRIGADGNLANDSATVIGSRSRLHWTASELVRFRDRAQLAFGAAGDETAEVFGPGFPGLDYSPVYRQWFPWMNATYHLIRENLAIHAGVEGSVVQRSADEPDLLVIPEQQSSATVGARVSLMDGRLTADWTAFARRTANLIVTIKRFIVGQPVPSLESAGVMSSEGTSLTLSGLLVERPKLGWEAKVHVTLQRNRVNDLFFVPVVSEPPVFEGWPVGVFVGYAYARDAAGNPIYVDSVTPLYRADTVPGSGIFSDFVFGDPIPNMILSWSNTVRLGENLRIDLLVDGLFGHQVVNQARAFGDWAGSTQIVAQEIMGDTAMGTYALNWARRDLLEEFVEDASFMRLRYLTVAYRLPKSVAASMGAGTEIWFNLAARNLVTLTRYSGLDPETAMYGSTGSFSGQDFGVIPNPSSVSVSLGLSF